MWGRVKNETCVVLAPHECGRSKFTSALGLCQGWHEEAKITTMSRIKLMPRFYQPDLTVNVDSPFVRDGDNKLIRRSYWLDMDDRALVMVMTKGIGANLTNDEKRAHLTDIKREHLIEQVCPQEILPPEK